MRTHALLFWLRARRRAASCLPPLAACAFSAAHWGGRRGLSSTLLIAITQRGDARHHLTATAPCDEGGNTATAAHLHARYAACLPTRHIAR